MHVLPGDPAFGITPAVDIADLPSVPPGHTVFFHPQRPRNGHQIFHMVEHVGWRIVDRPEQADWRVLYSLDTEIRLRETDPYAEQAASWLNGRCRDISKRRVERDFAEVFGYELAVDPTTYRGRCLRKADENCVKDATVIECPIPASDVAPGQVYERLVDGSQPDGTLIEHRVFVVGGTLPLVRRKVNVNWHEGRKLNITTLERSLVPPTLDFSPAEIAEMLDFCHVSGLDLGALDVIRDVHDGRIYILDVTKTPGAAQWNISSFEERDSVATSFCRAWLASFSPTSF
jgi:hypothetical protein